KQKLPDFKLPPVPENFPQQTSEQRQFDIVRIEFEGNTVLDEKLLHELAQPYEQHSVTPNELEDLRLKITQHYIDQGYVNSGAILTADAFKDSVLRFKMLEGHLDEIIIHGQEGLREGYIANRLRDRAPLGLSGMRSVLGTLWPVSDEAASLLMDEFYKALSQPNTSKVQALRQTQIKLLKQKDLENPFYWSPFILAGSWL
ncbi:MAG: CHAT domain-containing protein, partial [Methylococcales bacterium]|nr:CHAT domain-containing protein [Methylococcales bacterium]